MNNNDIKIGDGYKEPLKYREGFRYCFPIEIESKSTINACVNISEEQVPTVYFECKKEVDNSCYPEFNENREYITQLVLEKISSLDIEISDWASKVLATYNQIKTQIEESGYAKGQEILLNSGERLFLSLCSYGKIKSLNDVDFFLTDSEFIDSSESLYAIAGNIVNADKARELLKQDKKNLFSYYQETDFEYILQMPYESLDDRQKDELSFFSDWHKDVYGYRPRGLDNECQHLLDKERSNKDIELEK